jgi:transposase
MPCIGLVVTRDGVPLGYEVFAGNRTDVTTVEEIVTTMERRYGQADGSSRSAEEHEENQLRRNQLL